MTDLTSTTDSLIPKESPRSSFWTILRLPGLISYGCAYFCLKLIRYALLFWLPYYLTVSLAYSKETAGKHQAFLTTIGYLSTSFELGGIIGVVIAGWMSDRLVPGNRVLIAAPMVLMIAVCLVLYLLFGSLGIVANALTMGAVGCIMNDHSSLKFGNLRFPNFNEEDYHSC